MPADDIVARQLAEAQGVEIAARVKAEAVAVTAHLALCHLPKGSRERARLEGAQQALCWLMRPEIFASPSDCYVRRQHGGPPVVDTPEERLERVTPAA